MTVSRIKVEVAYARASQQKVLSVEVEEGTSLLDAARKSGITDYFPEINLDDAKLGVFGKLAPKPAVQTVRQGDRIEIYRPLIADPKEVRKRRAEQAKLKRHD